AAEWFRLVLFVMPLLLKSGLAAAIVKQGIHLSYCPKNRNRFFSTGFVSSKIHSKYFITSRTNSYIKK
ncbi:hypothetical protein, partial [Duganella fentianensis]|uniref:hypothetical protein n=1 Tax=Duganella fentianensis TaxID=2692177 RepID=UPI001E467861